MSSSDPPSASPPTPPHSFLPKKTMKAWTYTKGGLPSQVLNLTTDHPFPAFPPPTKQASASSTSSPEKDEEEWLLVRVKYAALNPGEILLMNLLPTLLSMSFSSSAGVPQVVGYDLTGEVIDISPTPTTSSSPPSVEERAEGKDIKTCFKKGTKIIAFLPVSFILSSKSGALQEYIAFPSKYAVLLPDFPSPRTGRDRRDSLAESAGLLLAGCTALEQIRNANLAPGHRVLVYGASGGIGSMAVQLAREAVGPEGKVVGVCSTRNLAAVWGLGVCDGLVDYTNPATIYTGGEIHTHAAAAADTAGEKRAKESVQAALARIYGGEAKFDAVIDCFGNQTLFRHSAAILQEEGVYSACGVHADGYGFAPVLVSGWKIMANALWPRSRWLGGTGRTWKAASMFDPGREMMEYLVGLFHKGDLKVLRDSEWRFEDLLGGYEVLLSGRARGKIVVKVAEDD